MPKTMSPPETETIVETPISRTDRAMIPPTPRDVLRIVHGFVMRAVSAQRHERNVLTTPGVVEAFDEALHEAAALKRTRE